MKNRIAKFLCNMGACSRRQAERLIKNGQVKINGIIIDSPIHFVNESDKVEINNIPILKPTPKMWIYYKPIMVITSHNDHRRTVFDEIKTHIKEFVISVGRLDYMSEGLLILTNSPKIAHFLENPRNNIPRSYIVMTHDNISKTILYQMQKGIEIDGIKYKPNNIEIHKNVQKNINSIKITLYEGKNREIRKIFAYFNIKILKLIRISYGNFYINDLKPGKITEINKNTVDQLLRNIENYDELIHHS